MDGALGLGRKTGNSRQNRKRLAWPKQYDAEMRLIPFPFEPLAMGLSFPAG
jgi:hypothetical protein